LSAEGTTTGDYLYVGYVVRPTLQANGQEGGVFSVDTGRETSVLELYVLCRVVSVSEIEPAHAPARVGELQRSVLDTMLAAEELRFMAFVGLEDGLRSTWEWVQKE